MSCEVRCKCHVNLCLKIRSPKKPVGCALRGTLPIPETQPRVSQGPHKRQDSATQSPHPTLTAMSSLHLQTPERLCGSLQPAGTQHIQSHPQVHRHERRGTQRPAHILSSRQRRTSKLSVVENADHTFQRNTVLSGMRYSQVAHKVHLIPMAQSCQHNTT